MNRVPDERYYVNDEKPKALFWILFLFVVFKVWVFIKNKEKVEEEEPTTWDMTKR